MVAYVRTVKTSSGATAVQIVWSTRRGSRKIEHLGSAHDEAGVAAFKAAAAQRLAAGQTQLDLGLVARSESEPLPITSSKSALMWQALCCAYDVLGFDDACGDVVPVINAFKTAHNLTDVTVVADAGMISEANQVALQTAGLSFILGTRIPYLPDVVREWHDKHPGEAIPDGLVLTQPWPASSAEKTRGIPDRLIHYQFRHDRARKTLRGIDEQVAKAQRAVDGHAPVKRNRYIQLTGATKSVNRTLEAKTRALAGWKGYTTNLATESAQFVIDAYHQLWRIEKAFRVSKHDLQARPIYHRTRDSIEAHLSVVFAAMALSDWIEHQTGWSIKKFVRTARRYRTVTIRAGSQTLTAAEPPPPDLDEALAKIHDLRAHSYENEVTTTR